MRGGARGAGGGPPVGATHTQTLTPATAASQHPKRRDVRFPISVSAPASDYNRRVLPSSLSCFIPTYA
ncbi:hypothetical protein LSTR_LSTR004594, partial [Laodelphax striatellus]